jgi:hypothetical protein
MNSKYGSFKAKKSKNSKKIQKIPKIPKKIQNSISIPRK